jgi:hypothetical protein
MSIFGKIWDRITDASKAAVGKDVSAKPTGTGATAAPGAAPVTNAAPTAGGTVAGGSMSAAAPSAPVDVVAIMTELDARNGSKSNWRHSIVDLMSLLGMENSLAERRALAQELGYTGDMSDTASMNIWLHKQVMKRMAENGGKVPADMLD